MSTRDDLRARDDLQDAKTPTPQHGADVTASAVSPNGDHGRHVRRIDCSASAEYRATHNRSNEDNPLNNRLRRDVGRSA
jgi:hypothetical protein